MLLLVLMFVMLLCERGNEENGTLGRSRESCSGVSLYSGGISISLSHEHCSYGIAF